VEEKEFWGRRKMVLEEAGVWFLISEHPIRKLFPNLETSFRIFILEKYFTFWIECFGRYFLLGIFFWNNYSIIQF